MNLQIDLFSNPIVLNIKQREVNYTMSRACRIEKDIKYYETLEPRNMYEISHISSVLSSLNKPRFYKKVLGNNCDSHLEVEKLGVCKYSYKNTIIVSLEDSLDYILHHLSGCSIEAVSSIKDYQLLSRGIMNLDMHLLKGFSVSSLIDLDPLLNRYLVSLGITVGEEEYIVNFLTSIHRKVSEIIEYIGVAVKQESNIDMVIRSKGYSCFVYSSKEDFASDILLTCEGKDEYVIVPHCYKLKEYYNDIETSYRR